MEVCTEIGDFGLGGVLSQHGASVDPCPGLFFARQISNTHRSMSMQVVARGVSLYGGATHGCLSKEVEGWMIGGGREDLLERCDEFFGQPEESCSPFSRGVGRDGCRSCSCNASKNVFYLSGVV